MTLEEKLKSKPTRDFAKMFMELKICGNLGAMYYSKFDPDMPFNDYEEALDYAVEKLLEEQPCYTDEEYKEIVSKRIKDEEDIYGLSFTTYRMRKDCGTNDY